MESKSNAERFLDAYAQLEAKMTSLCRETKYVPFSQLLSRLASKNRIISINQESLREYSELRNALVHMRGDYQEIIAEPCDSVTEDIERITQALMSEDSILNYACKPVKTVKKTDTILDAYKIMEEMDTSKIPVYEDHNYVGLLTMGMLAKYALENSSDGTVEQAMIHKDNERVLFLPKSSNAQLAIKGFDKAMREGNSLLAILITEHGKTNEYPLGIITYADFPTIMKD